MDLNTFNLPGCWVIDAFLSYMNYDKYNIMKEALQISNSNRKKYIEDITSIYDIEGISIDKCKIIVADEINTDSNSSVIFVLAAIPKEEYNINIKPIDAKVFTYISSRLASKPTAFGLLSPVSRKVFVKFIPDELCDINSDQFDIMEYLSNFYTCIDFAIKATECTYNLFIPEYSSEIFTIVYFLQIFSTTNNKEVVKRLFCDVFDCYSPEESETLTNKIFNLVGEDINNHLKDYNSFYRFIYKLDNLINENW